MEAIRMHRSWKYVIGLCCVFAVAIVVVACGTGSSKTTSGASTVNVMLSDPATCQAPNGPYSHVYVTISDVQANTSATAAATDSTWVDLTPGLSKTPKQVDLLGQANNNCFLATLGDNMQLQAGNYQQIRLILAANSATGISGNACGSATNCVVLASDNSVHTLQLSSEAQTGIKIPSGQIASGGFNIGAGQTEDLDIDFNTCSSIVVQGNGGYRLKPVLHAGEVSATSTSINGKILDTGTGNPIDGTAFISVEQKDSAGVDRIARSTTAAADGSFVFCPLPSGTFDVVITATRKDGVMYQPVIVTGVSVGSTVGTVSLSVPSVTATSTAALSGTVTSQNSATPAAGTVADVSLSALETVNSGAYTIPLPPTSTQSSTTLSVETAASTPTLTCPSGTDCVNYSMTLPSAGASIGAWSSSGVSLTAGASLAAYIVDGSAFVPGSGGAADCSPTEVKSPTVTLAGAGPFTATASTLGFVQCQ
jgi:hypothetical protein